MKEHIAQLHNRSFEKGSDVIVFNDPFTGERLRSDTPPRSIEAQPDLRDGLNFLRRRPDLDFKTFGEPHGDQDYTDPRDVKGLIDSSDVIFLEGFGHSQELDNLLWSVCTQNEGVNVPTTTIESLGEYKLRQLKLLAGIEKPVFIPEVAATGSSYEKDLLDYILILKELSPRAMAGDEQFAFHTLINLASSTIMRDWYMIAKMGQLMDIYENLSGDRLDSPLLWIGNAHIETMQPKLDGLGLRHRSFRGNRQVKNTPTLHVTNELHPSAETFDFGEAARNGVARIIKR